jgi:hypothetical protein
VAGLAVAGLRAPASRKIFVIGTGRSGTHWLGHILSGHPQIRVDFEKPPIFPWVTQIALDPSVKPRLLPKVLRQYRAEHALAAPRHYADKTHPTIWIADELALAFPEALFVGIKRSVHGTVASMLKHQGVMKWIHDWRSYPVPNRFLGIGPAEAADYEALSLAARCALRWRAHTEQLHRVAERLGDRCLLMDYEALQQETERELCRLGGFLELDTAIPVPEVRRTERSAEQIAEIDAIVAPAGREASSSVRRSSAGREGTAGSARPRRPRPGPPSGCAAPPLPEARRGYRRR